MSRPLIGQVFQDRYMIVSQLGAGGMGVVYRARQIDADREVAIKLLLPDSLDEESTGRFYREFKLLSKLAHPNIVMVYGLALDDEKRPYAISEFVEGKTLRSLMQEQEQLSWELANSIVLQLCDALHYVHEEKIVHRDLKPENIMLVDKPHPFFVKILDFGIARLISAGQSTSQKLTWTGQLLGSPQYMSPEQVEGTVDARSDIYSLACMYFEMIAGRPLFEADNPVGLVFKQKSEDPTERLLLLQKSTPHKLRCILHKALAKNPNDRYQSMAELSSDLKDLQMNPGAYAAPSESRKSFPALKIGIAALSALIVATVVVIGSASLRNLSLSTMEKRDADKGKASFTTLKSLFDKAVSEQKKEERRELLLKFEKLSRGSPNTQLRLEGLGNLIGACGPDEAMPYIQEMDALLKRSGHKLSKNAKQIWTIRSMDVMAVNLLARHEYDALLKTVADNTSYVEANDANKAGMVRLLILKLDAYKGLRDAKGIDNTIREFKNLLKNFYGLPDAWVPEFFISLIDSDLQLARDESIRREHLEFYFSLFAKAESQENLRVFATASLKIGQLLSSHDKLNERSNLLHQCRSQLDKKAEEVKLTADTLGEYCRIVSLEKVLYPKLPKTALVALVEGKLNELYWFHDAFPFASITNFTRAVHHFSGQSAALRFLKQLRKAVPPKNEDELYMILNPSTYLINEINDSLSYKLPDSNRIAFEKDFVLAAQGQNNAKEQLHTSRMLEWNISPLLEQQKTQEAFSFANSLLQVWRRKKIEGSEAFTHALFATIRVARDGQSKAARSDLLQLFELTQAHLKAVNYEFTGDDATELAVAVNRLVFGLCHFDLSDQSLSLVQQTRSFLSSRQLLTPSNDLILYEGVGQIFCNKNARNKIPEFKDEASKFVKLASQLTYTEGCVNDFRSAVLWLFRGYAALGLERDVHDFYSDLRKSTFEKAAENPEVGIAIFDYYLDYLDERPTNLPSPQRLADDYRVVLWRLLEQKQHSEFHLNSTAMKIADVLRANKKGSEAIQFLKVLKKDLQKQHKFEEYNELQWLFWYLMTSKQVDSDTDVVSAMTALRDFAQSKSSAISRAQALFIIGYVYDSLGRLPPAQQSLEDASALFDTAKGFDPEDRRYKCYGALSAVYDKQKETAKASQTLLRALNVARKMDATDKTELIAEYIVHHFEAMNQPAKAEEVKAHASDLQYLTKLLSS